MSPLFLLPSISPPFIFLPVLCIPGAIPTKDENKESDFWKMIHEPEDQAPGGEGVQAEVRAGFLAISLMRLNLSCGVEGPLRSFIMR